MKRIWVIHLILALLILSGCSEKDELAGGDKALLAELQAENQYLSDVIRQLEDDKQEEEAKNKIEELEAEIQTLSEEITRIESELSTDEAKFKINELESEKQGLMELISQLKSMVDELEIQRTTELEIKTSLETITIEHIKELVDKALNFGNMFLVEFNVDWDNPVVEGDVIWFAVKEEGISDLDSLHSQLRSCYSVDVVDMLLSRYKFKDIDGTLYTTANGGMGTSSIFTGEVSISEIDIENGIVVVEIVLDDALSEESFFFYEYYSLQYLDNIGFRFNQVITTR